MNPQIQTYLLLRYLVNVWTIGTFFCTVTYIVTPFSFQILPMYNSCFNMQWTRDGVKLAYFKLEFFWHMIMYGARAASIRHPRNLRPFCFKTNNNDVRTSRNMARIWLEKLHFFFFAVLNQEPTTRVVHKYDMIRHICIERV